MECVAFPLCKLMLSPERFSSVLQPDAKEKTYPSLYHTESHLPPSLDWKSQHASPGDDYNHHLHLPNGPTGLLPQLPVVPASRMTVECLIVTLLSEPPLLQSKGGCL